MAPKRDLTLAKTIGKNLFELRTERYPGHGGQLKCASDFGVPHGSWSQWESGSRIPSDENQRKLAVFFGVSVPALRGELPPEQPQKNPPPTTTARGGVITPEIQDLMESSASINYMMQNLILETNCGLVATQQVAGAFREMSELLQKHRAAMGLKEHLKGSIISG